MGQALMNEPFDIGFGVTVTFFFIDGVRAGLVYEHPSLTKPGERCKSGVRFHGRPHAEDGGPTHIVTSTDPLTLEPGLTCPTCGHHGAIIDGRWQPAGDDQCACD
jgi:hypothetical protein